MSIDSAEAIAAALIEQLLDTLRAPIDAGAGYFDALTGTTEAVNGPIVHYYRHHARLSVDPFFQYPPVAVAGQAMGSAGRAGQGTARGDAAARQPLDQVLQHRPVAAEQMAHSGGVQPQPVRRV